MRQLERITLWDRVALLIGSITLVFWVLFRFSTKSINFDLVGQQLLARQWIEGNFEGSMVGPTNYILKMVFLYMPAELLDIDPKLFLVASTILVNLLTFVGLYWVLKRILGYFSVETGPLFAISMIWLAAIGGSVFWIQFTNSRNLELLAGLVLLYLGLLLYKNVSLPRSVLFLVLAALTYSSDPMQLFITSVVLALYVMLNCFLFQKDKRREAFLIILLILAGYIMSWLLIAVTEHLTGTSLIAVSASPQIAELLVNLPIVAVETGKNALRLIGGTNEMGAWRQVVSVLVVGPLSVLSLVTLLKNKKYLEHRGPILLTGLLLVVPVAVYVASGQPLSRTDTSRYLILLAPALIILFSVSDLKNISLKVKKATTGVLAVLLCVAIGALVLATFQKGSEGMLNTAPLEARYGYLKANNYSYGYASMDTAIPSMYFFSKGKDEVLLPLSCEGTVLRRATLFFDKGVFMKSEMQDSRVPIILDGSSIHNHPSICSQAEIIAQLGEPLLVDTSGGDIVLIYNTTQLAKLDF